MKVAEILQGVLARESASARRAYLDRQCGANENLRAQVESLLSAHEDAGDFLEQPLLDLTATADLPPAINRPPATMIGPYKLLQEIGRGGFGIVYMAEQQEPVRRRVALKIIKPGMDSREVTARFEAERQALAMMEHPNIARVLDGGTTRPGFGGLDETGGRPYFVMELVHGTTITEYCDANKLPVRERLQLFLSVCHAVQHAHQKSVVHRDLKPSNIMVTLHEGQPVVKIIDFGIAKALDRELTERTLFTAYGQMVGTPQYMSPEQAEMSDLDVDTRSDIYSLGVLFYELLTGSTPLEARRLRAAACSEIHRLIREQEPPKPSTRISTAGHKLTILADRRGESPQRLHQLMRGELDWIALKALEKDRDRRYETALAMADDIERYLSDEPVRACPPSNVYRFWKFCRRHRAAVVGGSVVLLLLIVGSIGTTTGWLRAVRARRDLARQARMLEVKAGQLRRITDQAVAAEQREARLRRQAESHRQQAETKRQEANRNLYFAQMKLAHQALQREHPGTIERLLERWVPERGQPDLRGWEWYYLLGESRRDQLWTLFGHEYEVFDARWSPDGRRVASAGQDGTVRVWDTTTGKEVTRVFSEQHEPQRLDWSADGSLLAAGDTGGLIRLWGGPTLEPAGSLVGHSRQIMSVCLSPDASRLASTCWDRAIKVWDLETRKELRSFFLAQPADPEQEPVYEEVPLQAALSPDGQYLAAISQRSCKVWEVSTAKLILDLSDEVTMGRCVAWSPDGSQLAVSLGWKKGCNFIVAVLDIQTRQRLFELRGHLGMPLAVAWNSTGQLLATGSHDHTVRIWDGENGRLLSTLSGHDGHCNDVAWAPDGNRLVSAGSDSTVRVWKDGNSSRGARALVGHSLLPTCVAWSPDGQRLVSGGAAHEVRVWDYWTGDCIISLEQPSASVDVTFSPDGTRVAAVGTDHAVRIWDLATADELATLEGHDDWVGCAAWSPDGTRLASCAADRTVRIWNPTSGQLLTTLSGHANRQVRSVSWSADGLRLASLSPLDLIVRDTTNWRILLREQFPYADSTTVAFQPQGRFLARAHGHNVVIHDLESELPVRTLRAHTANVRDLSWSPDGNQLASAGHEGTVRVWHVETGQEVLALTAGDGSAYSVAWSPDGQALAAACSGGAVRIWDASEGHRLVEDPTFLDAITSYRRRRVRELIGAGKLKQAVPLLSAVLRWRPDDSRLFEQRGQLHARLGHWRRAAEDFARAAQLAPQRGILDCSEAVTRLRSGHVDGYRRACRRLIERAREAPGDKTAAARAGWLCLFGYEHIRHVPFARQMVEQLPKVTEDEPELRYGPRLAALRCGRIPPALRKQDDTGLLSEFDRAPSRLVESLRLIQLGRRQQAAASYAACRPVIESLAAGDAGPKWWKLAQCEILAAEVEALLEK